MRPGPVLPQEGSWPGYNGPANGEDGGYSVAVSHAGRCRGRATEKWRWSKVVIASAFRRSATAITDASTRPSGKSP